MPLKNENKNVMSITRRVVLAGVTAMVPSCVPGAGPAIDGGEGGPRPEEGDGGQLPAMDAGHGGPVEDGGWDGGLDAGTDGGVTPQCLETEDNILGPFYRPDAPFRNDLSQPGETQRLVIEGTVQGAGCGPLPGALLDVWQAGPSGDYDNSSSDYRWRGRLYAGADGSFLLHTTVPGRYLNGNTFRPQHLHLRVSANQHRLLTTQLYFKGDPYLSTDPFVHPSLVIPLVQMNGYQWGRFDIVLART